VGDEKKNACIIKASISIEKPMKGLYEKDG
jgi:hypothetical protein